MMSLTPSEFAIAEVYFLPVLIVSLVGYFLAWQTALLLNRFRLSRYFFYPPLVFTALAVIYTVLIGTFVIPS
jgi:hypothetical protein